MTTDLEVNGKRVLVVGLGKSGVASALFLKAKGARVTVSDAKSEEQLGGKFRRCSIRALPSKPVVTASAHFASRTSSSSARACRLISR